MHHFARVFSIRVRERLSSPYVLSRKGDTGLADRDPYQGARVPTARDGVLGNGPLRLDKRGARQLEADGAGLAPFSRRTGARIRTRVHATVHRRANAIGRPAATAGSAQGRRQEGIIRLSSRLAAGTRRAILRSPFRPEGSDDSFHRTPRVHHASRRRGSRVADRGAHPQSGGRHLMRRTNMIDRRVLLSSLALLPTRQRCLGKHSNCGDEGARA